MTRVITGSDGRKYLTDEPLLHPPKREWVGIEAEDLAEIDSDKFWSSGNHMSIAMAVEAILKEKNT